MPAGNWNFKQNVNPQTGWVEWPTGPLKLNGSERPIWLEAWVMQRSTGASQTTFVTDFSNPSQWTADGLQGGEWQEGAFKAGPAMGIAIVSTRDDKGTSSFFWWAEEIHLE